ncbi:MAG: hypothetical protein KKA19_07310 [Candidatus Margulisbacteria bacterium]|nr:hypothetical protein [Candidatus Margulisiibacteriota bacterium]
MTEPAPVSKKVVPNPYYNTDIKTQDKTIDGRTIISALNNLAKNPENKLPADIAQVYVLLCLQGYKFSENIYNQENEVLDKSFVELLKNVHSKQKRTIDEYENLFLTAQNNGLIKSMPTRTRLATEKYYGSNGFDGMEDLIFGQKQIIFEVGKAKENGWLGNVEDLDGNSAKNDLMDQYLTVQNKYFSLNNAKDFVDRKDLNKDFTAAVVKAQKTISNKNEEDTTAVDTQYNDTKTPNGAIAYYSSIKDQKDSTMTYKEKIEFAARRYIMLNQLLNEEAEKAPEPKPATASTAVKVQSCQVDKALDNPGDYFYDAKSNEVVVQVGENSAVGNAWLYRYKFPNDEKVEKVFIGDSQNVNTKGKSAYVVTKDNKGAYKLYRLTGYIDKTWQADSDPKNLYYKLEAKDKVYVIVESEHYKKPAQKVCRKITDNQKKDPKEDPKQDTKQPAAETKTSADPFDAFADLRSPFSLFKSPLSIFK